MKIIDLLNKIANGEEAPKKIKYEGVIFYYNDYHDYKCYNDRYYLFSDLFVKHYDITTCLNDEVEILDEPKEYKKIIKIKEENGWCGKQSTGNEIILKMKVNELIDEVNKLKENNEPK